MLRELMYKIFRLEPPHCLVCDALREQLTNSERERRELLQRVLAPSVPEPVEEAKEELKPIQSQFVPWRVRQQMLEAEDRHKASLLKNKQKEISALEEELGIAKEIPRGESGGVSASEIR